jgi:hypothetical protein
VTLLTIALLGGALLMAGSAGLVFILAVRRGQFDRIEDVKYQMLREEESR